MGCGVVAAKDTCGCRLGDVLRNVGCCDGIPAGEIGGIGAFDDCVSTGPVPTKNPRPFATPFGANAAESPWLGWPAVWDAWERPYCGLMAGWVGYDGVDGARWCPREGTGGGDIAEAYEEVGETAPDCDLARWPLKGEVLEDPAEFE